MESVMRDAGERVVQAEKKHGQNALAWEELGVSEGIKAAQNIRNTVSRREGGQTRWGLIIQCMILSQKNTTSCYNMQQKAMNRFIVLTMLLWLSYGEQTGGDRE